MLTSLRPQGATEKWQLRLINDSAYLLVRSLANVYSFIQFSSLIFLMFWLQNMTSRILKGYFTNLRALVPTVISLFCVIFFE